LAHHPWNARPEKLLSRFVGDRAGAPTSRHTMGLRKDVTFRCRQRLKTL
jgi:hypothetical protein